MILFEHHTIALGRRCSDTHHIESTIKRIDWLKYKLFPELRGSLDQGALSGFWYVMQMSYFSRWYISLLLVTSTDNPRVSQYPLQLA